MKMALLALETKFYPLRNIIKKGSCNSKLEQYVAILRLLSSKGPVNLEFIMKQTPFSSNFSVEKMNFLIELNLVEKETGKFGLLYLISNMGEKVVRYFG
jgi:predicted transcriptional regulator